MDDLKDKKVLLGMPCGSGSMPAMMVQSLLGLEKPCVCAFSVIERQATVKARNYFVKMALDEGFDYLLMIDDDNPVPSDTLKVLLEADKDVVIAPILARNPVGGEFPLCAFYAEEHKLKDGRKVKLYDNIKDFRDEGPLHQIDAGGTGCMLIKRSVLERLYEKFKGEVFALGDETFEEQVIRGKKIDRRTMSEDVEFCERAVEEGFEIWLDDRIRPKHICGLQVNQYK